MPHDLDHSTGHAAIFTAHPQLVPPWHGLGTVVRDAPTSDDAIRLARLDWNVEQWPLHATSPHDEKASPAPGQVANVRIDTRAVLGVVTPRYEPFQSADAFRFADAIVGEGDARYESAGALRGGRRVWMLLKLPDVIRVNGDDVIEPYLLVFNTHDGSSCLRTLLTPTRVVCANTLVLALGHFGGGRGAGVSLRHRGDLQPRVEEARVTLGLVRRGLHRYADDARAMCRVAMTGGRLDAYFDNVLPPLTDEPTPREAGNRDAVLGRLHVNFEDDTNRLAGVRGSLWAAFNAVTQYANHQRPARGGSDHSKRASRLDGLWFGRGRELNDRAYDAALTLAAQN